MAGPSRHPLPEPATPPRVPPVAPPDALAAPGRTNPPNDPTVAAAASAPIESLALMRPGAWVSQPVVIDGSQLNDRSIAGTARLLRQALANIGTGAWFDLSGHREALVATCDSLTSLAVSCRRFEQAGGAASERVRLVANDIRRAVENLNDNERLLLPLQMGHAQQTIVGVVRTGERRACVEVWPTGEDARLCATALDALSGKSRRQVAVRYEGLLLAETLTPAAGHPAEAWLHRFVALLLEPPANNTSAGAGLVEHLLPKSGGSPAPIVVDGASFRSVGRADAGIEKTFMAVLKSSLPSDVYKAVKFELYCELLSAWLAHLQQERYGRVPVDVVHRLSRELQNLLRSNQKLRCAARAPARRRDEAAFGRWASGMQQALSALAPPLQEPAAEPIVWSHPQRWPELYAATPARFGGQPSSAVRLTRARPAIDPASRSAGPQGAVGSALSVLMPVDGFAGALMAVDEVARRAIGEQVQLLVDALRAHANQPRTYATLRRWVDAVVLGWPMPCASPDADAFWPTAPRFSDPGPAGRTERARVVRLSEDLLALHEHYSALERASAAAQDLACTVTRLTIFNAVEALMFAQLGFHGAVASGGAQVITDYLANPTREVAEPLVGRVEALWRWQEARQQQAVAAAKPDGSQGVMGDVEEQMSRRSAGTAVTWAIYRSLLREPRTRQAVERLLESYTLRYRSALGLSRERVVVSVDDLNQLQRYAALDAMAKDKNQGGLLHGYARCFGVYQRLWSQWQDKEAPINTVGLMHDAGANGAYDGSHRNGYRHEDRFHLANWLPQKTFIRSEFPFLSDSRLRQTERFSSDRELFATTAALSSFDRAVASAERRLGKSAAGDDADAIPLENKQIGFLRKVVLFRPSLRAAAIISYLQQNIEKLSRLEYREGLEMALMARAGESHRSVTALAGVNPIDPWIDRPDAPIAPLVSLLREAMLHFGDQHGCAATLAHLARISGQLPSRARTLLAEHADCDVQSLLRRHPGNAEDAVLKERACLARACLVLWDTQAALTPSRVAEYWRLTMVANLVHLHGPYLDLKAEQHAREVMAVMYPKLRAWCEQIATMPGSQRAEAESVLARSHGFMTHIARLWLERETPGTGVTSTVEDVVFDPLTGRCWLGAHRLVFGASEDLLAWLRSQNIVDRYANITGQQGWMTLIGDDCKAMWTPHQRVPAEVWKRFTVDGTEAWFEKVSASDLPAALTTVLRTLSPRSIDVFFDTAQPIGGRAYIVFGVDADDVVYRATIAADGTMAVFRCPQPGDVLQLVAAAALPSTLLAHDRVIAWRNDTRITRFTFVDSQLSFAVDADDQARWCDDPSFYVESVSSAFFGRSGSLCMLENDFGQRRGLVRVHIDASNKRGRYAMVVEVNGQGSLRASRGDESLALAAAYLQEKDYAEALRQARRAAHALRWDVEKTLMSDLMEESLQAGRNISAEQLAIEAVMAVAMVSLSPHVFEQLMSRQVDVMEAASNILSRFDESCEWSLYDQFFSALATSYIERRRDVPKELRLTALEELRLFRRAEERLKIFVRDWQRIAIAVSRDIDDPSRQPLLALAQTNCRRYEQLRNELRRLQERPLHSTVKPAAGLYGDQVAWVRTVTQWHLRRIEVMMTEGASSECVAEVAAATWPTDAPEAFLRNHFQVIVQQLTSQADASAAQLIRKLELYDCGQSTTAAVLRKILLNAARHPVAARALLTEDGAGVSLVSGARWLREDMPLALRQRWHRGGRAPVQPAADPGATVHVVPSRRAKALHMTLTWFAYWYCYRPQYFNRREQMAPQTIVAGPLPHADPVSLFPSRPPISVVGCPQISMLADAVAAHPAQLFEHPRTDWRAGRSADPVVHEQRAGIAERIDDFARAHLRRRQLPHDGLDELRRRMQALASTQTLTHLERELLAFANIEDEDEGLRVQHRNDRNARLTRPVSLSTLLRAYALDHLAILSDDNPALKDAQLPPLAERTRQYLLHKTQQQQAARVLETLDQLSRATAAGHHEVAQRLSELAYEQLAAVRHYDPQAAPALLVFEAHNSILLTAAQIDVLEKFTARGESGWPKDIVQQLEMGGGKTRVLMPLLLFLLARGEAIPIALVPAELYAVNAQDLQRTSEATFGQMPYCFSFSRETVMADGDLERILDDMQDVARAGGYVVTTKESIQSFRLRYIDLLQRACSENPHSYVTDLVHRADELVRKTVGQPPASESDTDTKLRLMAKILCLWQQRGICLLDEVDTLLNVRNEFNYNLNKSTPLSGAAISVVKQLYRVLSCDPWVREQVELRRNEQHRLTIQQTREILTHCRAPLLAAVLPHTESLTDADRQLLQEYLTSTAPQLPAAADLRRLVEAAPGGADRLVLLREQLLTLLPATLRRHGGEHYGVPASQPLGFAIPYVKGRPVWGANFGNVLETTNYTYQWYLAEGVSPAAVRQLAQRRVEALTQERLGRQPDARQWAEALRWQRLVAGSVWEGRVLQKADLENDQAIGEVSALISGDFARVSIVLEAYVLPLIPLYTENATSNGIDLVDAFRVCQGFSGTTWNASTYHPKLDSMPSNVTDGITFGAFLQPTKTTSFCSQATDVGALLREQSQCAGQRDVRAVIDVGGTFLHLAPIEVARHIRAYLQDEHVDDVRHVLFFDPGSGNLCAWDCSQAEPKVLTGSSAATLRLAGIAPEHSFAYFDQAHSIGADLPLSPTAKAVLTIGPLTNLRDVQQGAMRMRQLARGQSLCLALSPDFAAAYRGADVQSASVEQILDHCIEQQATMLAHDKERAFAVGLWSEAFRCAIQAIQVETGNESRAVAQAFLPLLVQKVGLPTFEGHALSCHDETLRVFGQQAARFADVIDGCVKALPVLLRQRAGRQLSRLAVSMRSPEFVEQASRKLGALSPTARRVAGETALGGQEVRSEVQAQTQQEVEVEVEVIQDTLAAGSINLGTWTDAHHIARPYGLPDGRPQPTTTVGWALGVARRAVSKAGRKVIDFGIYIIDLIKKVVPCIGAATREDWPALASALKALKPYLNCVGAQCLRMESDPIFRVAAANQDFDRPLYSENVFVSDSFRRTLGRQSGLNHPATKAVMFFLAIQHADTDEENLTFVAVTTEEAETFRSRRDTGLAPWAKRMSLYDAQGQLVTPGPKPIAGNAAQMTHLRRAVVEFKGMSSKSENTLRLRAEDVDAFRGWLSDGDEGTRRARRDYLFGESAGDDDIFADFAS